MSGPGRVRLPPNAFKLRQNGINEFRDKAMAFARDELVDVNLYSFGGQVPEWLVDQPLAVTQRIGNATHITPPKIGGCAFEGEIDDQAVLMQLEVQL